MTDGSFRLPEIDDCQIMETDGDEFNFYSPCRLRIINLKAMPSGLIPVGLRESYLIIGKESWNLATKGAELLSWSGTMKYCGSCGSSLKRASEISYRCPDCGIEQWPRLNPAIMVLVKKGDEALLVHACNFRTPAYGLVAGFVETGETLEECAEREVLEETSLHIANLKYFGSQSWPFPASLMIGFTAEYASGTLAFADSELNAGGFFKKNSLPEIATPPSLANTMIEAWKRGEI